MAIHVSDSLGTDGDLAVPMVRCGQFEPHGMALRGRVRLDLELADEDGSVRVYPSRLPRSDSELGARAARRSRRRSWCRT